MNKLCYTNLADAWQGLEHDRHLHLADGVVLALEHLLQRELPGLQLALQLGTSLPRGGG